MIEPAASLRLQRVRDAYESSPSYRPGAAAVPSSPLRADGSPPSDAAVRPTIPPLADGYAAFRESAFATESVSAAFLATIAVQAEALALVWEAHARGALTLPPQVAAAVSAARAAAH